MAKFNETSQEASLGVPLQKYNKASQLIMQQQQNVWLPVLLLKTSPLKLPLQIQGNFTGSFLGCPSAKIKQGVTIDYQQQQQQQSGRLPVLL